MGMDAPPSWASALAFVAAMVGAILLSAALTTLFNITMLWTTSGDGMAGMAPALATALSGILVPIPLFPEWAQTVLNALPFTGLQNQDLQDFAFAQLALFAITENPAKTNRGRHLTDVDTCAGRILKIL